MESEVIHHNMSILLNAKNQSYELFLNSMNGKLQKVLLENRMCKI